MSTTNRKKFKGEIENYLNNGLHNFESKIDGAFSALKFKTWLCKSNIVKKDGYHASHLLFILVNLPSVLRFPIFGLSFSASPGLSGLFLHNAHRLFRCISVCRPESGTRSPCRCCVLRGRETSDPTVSK